MESRLPKTRDINELVAYYPRIYSDEHAVRPQWHAWEKNDNGTLALPWPEYPDVVREFFTLASRNCWNDYDYELEKAGRLLKKRRFLKHASLEEIKTVLTYCVRGERFCDGHWEEMIKGGHIRRILDRLREFLPRFEFCALKYLNMWLNEESGWCAAMAENDQENKLVAMSKFAAAYRISRNLHRKYDADRGIPRFKPVLDIIEKRASSSFQSQKLVSTVERVRKQISSFYGGVDVLSLTTKFLWLKFKSPVILYDRRARFALRTRHGDLAEYHSRWRRMFDSYQDEIAAACNSLLAVRNYAADSRAVTRQFISEIASQQWFHERVFDIYLWTIGGDQ